MSELKFPLFISLTNKRTFVFGGGTVARRRVDTLLKFGADVTVISTGFADELLERSKTGQIKTEQRPYRPGEISGAFMVIAATDDPEVNHQIVLEAKSKNILVNNASDQTDCDFYFPAVVVGDDLSIGLCGTGQDHRMVRMTAAKIREIYGK